MVETRFSVGKKNQGAQECPNLVEDQLKIINLLNQVSLAQGGTRETPLRTSPIANGTCAPGLYRAIIAFQKKQHLTEDGHIDPQGIALSRLNLLTPKATGGDDSLPATSPYLRLPPPLLNTLRISYNLQTSSNDNLSEGFAGADKLTKSFKQVLDTLDGKKHLAAIEKVYKRAVLVSGLWSHVQAITTSYAYDTSYGFQFSTSYGAADGFLRASTNFCGDLPPGESTHQSVPRHCYRELGYTGKPGLHICLATQAGDNGKHDIHIDPHQCVRAKTRKSTCWYADLSSHFGDVGRWIVDDKVMPYLDAKVATAGYGVPTLWPHYRKGVRDWILDLIMNSSDNFDVFERSIDKPPPIPSNPVELVLTGIINTALKDFKAWYMDNV